RRTTPTKTRRGPPSANEVRPEGAVSTHSEGAGAASFCKAPQSSRGRRVGTVCAVTLLEFFPGADRLYIVDAVNAQDSVEMIDFVLQQFGEVAMLASLDLLPFTADVLIANGDVFVPFDLHENCKEAEASVPYDNLLRAAPDDLRIDERPRLGARQLEEDDALEDS